VALIISFYSLTKSSFAIQLHLRQECVDDLCIPFCVISEQLICHNLTFQKSNRKILEPNLKSNCGLLNRIFIVPVLSLNVLKSQFKSQLRLGFAITSPSNKPCGVKQQLKLSDFNEAGR